MKLSNKQIVIEHSALNLFNIVLDLKKYPDFIPWCSNMNIISKKNNEIFADMYVVYKFLLPQKFGSHVVFDKKKLIIKTTYINGPLKDLSTNWEFVSISKTRTQINFNIKFQFKNFLHQKLAETFYPLIENKMVKSFENRANQLFN